MKKVISICAFGDVTHGMYVPRLPTFVLAHLNLFPLDEKWHLVVHVDPEVGSSAYGLFLRHLMVEGVLSLVVRPEAPLCKAMLWRMLPVWSDADYVFLRDLDALPLPRDRAACEGFLESGATVHTIHDHTHHVGFMGGLSGFQAPRFRLVTGMVRHEWLHRLGPRDEAAWETKGADQDVLNALCNRADGPLLLEHRYHGWGNGEPGLYVPRGPGEYLCKSLSVRMPDQGSSRLPERLRGLADALAPHLGAAGYNTARAYGFWYEHGDRDVAKLVRSAEVAAGMHRSF